jgi:hypothetical protein
MFILRERQQTSERKPQLGVESNKRQNRLDDKLEKRGIRNRLGQNRSNES